MIKSLSYCLVVMLLIVGCKSVKPSADSDAERYTEDLSVIRPEYKDPEVLSGAESIEEIGLANAVIPVADVTEELDAILDSVDILREDVRYIDGFTILVYSGTNSAEATLTKGKIYSLIPESAPESYFDEPNFKVKLGKFYSKMEAQKLYSQLRENFPDAIIIPERIYIR